MRLDKTLLAIAMARRGMNFIRLSDACGVSRQTLSQINSGKACRAEVAGKIAQALGIDVTDLIKEV